MRLGAPVFTDSRDPDEIAAAHSAAGYRAAYCPHWLSVGDESSIRAIQHAFAARDLVIAEVGAWGHIIHPEEEVRRKNLEQVIRKLALAEAVGARCCVDYTGSYGAGWFHPRNLSAEAVNEIVEVARRIIDAVRPTRTVLALEMMPAVHPENADDYLALMAAVNRPGQFGVHLDPVNIINSPQRYYGNGAVIRDCFEKLGPFIASCHAKDVIVRDSFIVHLDECRPGTGTLDYRTYLHELSRLPQEPPLMLEHLPNEQEYLLARDYLFALAGEIGLGF
jgi:sugar phosphate isomerase/epimerase